MPLSASPAAPSKISFKNSSSASSPPTSRTTKPNPGTSPSLRPPNSKLPAGVQQTHHVQHAVVVPAIPRRHRSIPQRIHKQPCPSLILSRETSHSIRPHQANRCIRLRRKPLCRPLRLPIQRINRAVLPHPLRSKKSLNPIAQHRFLRILPPPRPIHRPVAGRPPRVIPKLRRLHKPRLMRSPIEVRIHRRQSRLRICRLHKIFPAHLRRLRPELAILLRTPSRPKLIKRRQMIRRIAERMLHHTRHKQNHRVLFIHLRANLPRPELCLPALHLTMPHRPQQSFRLRMIVIDPRSTPPPIRDRKS